MSRILIVDDEEKIREVIKEYAEFNGYDVTCASDGMMAIELCQSNTFDVIIMDIMMPKIDGFHASKEIKKLKDIPIIMLSARGEEYDKLFGFELGIDDYVVKPFSPKEIIARIKAVINRSAKAEKTTRKHNKYEYKGLVVDMDARNVFVDGKKADMTPKEYDLLFFLIKNKNIAFSREKLLNEVWGYDFYGDDRTIDTHIKMLRNSIRSYRNLIITVRGIGYKFED